MRRVADFAAAEPTEQVGTGRVPQMEMLETADRVDFTWKVVAIATRRHGSVVDAEDAEGTVHYLSSTTRVVPGTSASMAARRAPYSGESTSSAHITSASSFVSM